MKTIGQINYEMVVKTPALRWPTWDGSSDGIRTAFEMGAKATALHVLDLLVTANVSPREAAAALRAGRTLEELCDPGDPEARIHRNSLADIETDAPREGCKLTTIPHRHVEKILGAARLPASDPHGDGNEVTREAGGPVVGQLVPIDPGFGMDAGPWPHPRSEPRYPKSCSVHTDCDEADRKARTLGYRNGSAHAQ